MTFKSFVTLPAMTAVGYLLDALLPRRCPCCECGVASGLGLCGSCWQQVRFLERPWCQRMGTPFTHDVGENALSPRAIADPPEFDRLRAVAFYTGPVKDLVLALKFARRRELAEAMGTWMARSGAEFLGDSLVIPVPLHWTRLWQRRFNQAADLARVVANISGADYAPFILKRTRRTQQQVGLPAKARKRNVRRAFQVPDNQLQKLAGQRVVLVDDVYTTGSTVSACTKVLKSAGAGTVDVLTFALADPANHEDVDRPD
ncbi:ComF family protein [Labrenzia sp. R4_1]|uniref:ComF family protein n=1 Tax=Labrenzia sp. R4_1 TaxID=2821106 RepID=UPI001ADB1C89|nr:ComF family protein [Labrenzia sp. R4_1]